MGRVPRAVILFGLVVGPCAGGPPPEGERPARPSLATRCVLEAVLARMGVAFRDDLEVPAVLFESATSLRRFQRAAAPQWGFTPEVFANAYVAARNEIYLVDAAAAYRRPGRSIDDSLAHELTHYVQARYLGQPLDDDPSLESQAVDVQGWFREAHARGAPAPGACGRLALAATGPGRSSRRPRAPSRGRAPG